MSRYDQERFDPGPDPDLVCCICQAVLDGPQETPCRHVFCKICIETWLSNHQTCPTCRKNIHKEDLRPVLPIIQNMINRLQMKCRNSDRGCINTIPLENIDNHEISCGYEQLFCRFVKCGRPILKKDREEHEGVLCEHREAKCMRECGLMIPVKELDSHDCLCALKTKIAEQEKSLNKIQQQVECLTSNRDSLEQKLSHVEQKLQEAIQRLQRVQDGSISDQISDFNDDASTRTWNTEYTLDGFNENSSVASNHTDISVVVDDSVSSPGNLLVTSQDSADRSAQSESTGGNSPMILFSSNAGRALRVNFQGNASVSYAGNNSRSSGSETSGFIAESSGYGQSPVHRFMSDSDGESRARSRQSDSDDQRPAAPEPPLSLNNSSHETGDDDDDANSIAQASLASPVHSFYSVDAMSDSDTADALRDLLNMTPPTRASSNSSASPVTSTPRARSKITPSTSVDELSDSLRGFSSSDDVSDEVESNTDTHRIPPFYSNDALSDDDFEFVNNSPSPSRESDEESRDRDESNHSRSRGFLSSDSGSDGSGDSKSVKSKSSDGESVKSDQENADNESNLTFSVSSRNTEDELEHESHSPQARVDTESRSRRESGESGRIDVQSLLDELEDENAGLTMQQEHNKSDSTASDEYVEKSLAKLTEALEEMADEAEEIEAKLVKGETKRGDTRSRQSANNNARETADDESYVDVIGLVRGNINEVKDPMENSLSLREHLTSAPRRDFANTSSILNTSESSVVEVNSMQPSNGRGSLSRIKNEFAQAEEKPSTSYRQSNRSRCAMQSSTDIHMPSTSREQDRHLELLEEKYALKRENKNRDVERYVDHVQRMMSIQSNEVKQGNQEGVHRASSHDSDTRPTAKRKHDQQVDVLIRGAPSKKAKYEERSEWSQKTSVFVGRNEATREISNERSGSHTHRRTTSSAGVGENSRKSVDKKHTWDPKNLNISLNVAINLDKARDSGQGASTSTSLPVSGVQQAAGRSALHSRRSTPANFRHSQRTVRDRIKVEHNQSLQQLKSRERPSSSGNLPHGVKTEHTTQGLQGKLASRSFSKATSTVSKPPTTTTIAHPSRRPRRSAVPSTFTPSAQNDSDSSSEQDMDYQPPIGDEPSDESISSSEENDSEERSDYKLKIPIPTATLLEKYKNCDDSDDSWNPPV